MSSDLFQSILQEALMEDLFDYLYSQLESEGSLPSIRIDSRGNPRTPERVSQLEQELLEIISEHINVITDIIMNQFPDPTTINFSSIMPKDVQEKIDHVKDLFRKIL